MSQPTASDIVKLLDLVESRCQASVMSAGGWHFCNLANGHTGSHSHQFVAGEIPDGKFFPADAFSIQWADK